MPGHDDLFKELLRHFFADLLHLVVPAVAVNLVAEEAEFLDPELFIGDDGTRRQVDLAARVPTVGGDGRPVLVHVEIEAEAREAMEGRMLEYAVLLHGRYGLPVLPLVIYLKGGPGAGIETSVAQAQVGGMTVLTVHYAALSLSRSRAEDYLAHPAPLARMIQCAVKRRRSPVGSNPTRQLVAPAGSNRSGRGGDEAAEAFGVEGRRPA